jgi:hypothetical protein
MLAEIGVIDEQKANNLIDSVSKARDRPIQESTEPILNRNLSHLPQVLIASAQVKNFNIAKTAPLNINYSTQKSTPYQRQ